MAIENFDKYILHFPDLDRLLDFNAFWEKSIKELKKAPLEPVVKKNSKKSTAEFINYEVAFKGFGRVPATGELIVPAKKRTKPRIIIYIHDYNSRPRLSEKYMDTDTAYYIMTLRGHATLPPSHEDEHLTPGFMIEGILDKDDYFVRGMYLDTLRSIELLRLVDKLDCSSIGIMGKGMGAACAIFTASFSDRVKGLVLDAPSFCELPLCQNIARNDAVYEINEFISKSKKSKKQVKQNLTYFDALNFTDLVQAPVYAVCGFKDTTSPPECTFGLFNRLMCEKTIEVYPEEGYSAGGTKQLARSLEWLKKQISQ